MKTQLKELFLLHFLNDGIRTTFVILLPFIAKDISISLAQVGFLGSSQPLLGALLALPTGFIMGRFTGFRIILTLLILYSLAAIGLAFAFSLPLVLITFYIAALGFGMFHTVGFALTARSSTPATVGVTMGNFTSVGEIGRIALPPLAILLTSFIGWRVTMAAIGIIGLLIYGIVRFLQPPRETKLPHTDEVPQNYKEFLKDIILLFKNKQALTVTIAAIIDSLASSPIYVYLPFLLISYGIHAIQLSIAMGAFCVGSLLGKYALGRIIGRIGNRNVFIISELCMAIALFFIAHTSSFFLILLIAVLLGVFTKGTSPVVQTLFSELADQKHYHKVYAVSELAIGLAAVLTILVMGALADKTGITSVFYLSAIFALFATIPIGIFTHGKN